MHNQDFFIQALIYLLAAVISVPIAKRLGLGSVLGYLLAGILIGPYVLGFIGTGGEDIMHFAEFGVVMMLFLIGLELRPSLLWQMRKSIFGLGGLQVLASATVITCIVLLFDLPVRQSMAVGLILALSSTAIVLQTLSEKGLLKSPGGQSAFSVLLFQDIAVIPILAFLPLLAAGDLHQATSQAEHGFVGSLEGWMQFGLIVGVVGGIILIGKFAARHIFRAIASTGLREIFTATALLIVVAITIAMSSVGLSPALGTFLAGVVLADNEYRHELESDIEPFKGLLLGLFFIAVGASINFSLLAEKPLLILGLLFGLVLVKALILLVISGIFKLPAPSKWLLTLALAQGGEFAFVLISFTLQNNILETSSAELITLVVALSMAVSPVLFLINEYLIQPIYRKKEEEKPGDEIPEKDNPLIIAGFGRFGVVIGRLLLASGFRRVTILDHDPSHIETLRKFGFKVYYGDASRSDLLEAAGISEAKVLVIALDDSSRATQIAEYVKRNHPHVKICARAYNISHASELGKLGVDHIRLELAHSAIELGIAALRDLGFTSFQAHRAAKIFRYHSRNVRADLSSLREEDQNRYISEVKKRAEQLEDLLRQEMEHSIHESDAAWDSTTLREEVIEIFSEMKDTETDKT